MKKLSSKDKRDNIKEIKNFVIISDVHLREPENHITKLFIETLDKFILEKKNKTSEIEAIFLLGDIFDFITVSKSFFIKLWKDVFNKFLEIKSLGISIYFIEGNHDFGFEHFHSKKLDKYFIDFADPVLKIGIECDGKQHDKEKDSIRDKNLIELGWKIFRIPGYKCKNLPNTTLSEIMQDEEYYSTELTDRIYDFFNESIDGFLEAIYHCYYFDINSFRHKKSVFKVLKEHQLIKFELF